MLGTRAETAQQCAAKDKSKRDHENNGPDLWGFGGWGRDRGRALSGGRERPRLYTETRFNNINLWLSVVNDERKLLFYRADICDKQSQHQIAMGHTYNYLNATEPQSLTEVRKR
jgi:hypothetical protein